jgi:hypothetical protein
MTSITINPKAVTEILVGGNWIPIVMGSLEFAHTTFDEDRNDPMTRKFVATEAESGKWILGPSSSIQAARGPVPNGA